MTREEIIRNLKYTMKKHENDRVDTFGTNISLMCKDILDYLEQEPCDDAISRQAVLDAMYELCNTRETLKENPWRDNPHIDAITDAINALPPATPQQKTGRWIFDEILDKHYYCSECKSMGVNYWDFCPNCGAKMVEPQESEE
jgi:hypothetical protein